MRLPKLLRRRAAGGEIPKQPRRYGGDKTIHGNTALDIEVGPDGEVVAVWFRCQVLPFRVAKVDAARAADMKSFGRHSAPSIVGLEMLDG